MYSQAIFNENINTSVTSHDYSLHGTTTQANLYHIIDRTRLTWLEHNQNVVRLFGVFVGIVIESPVNGWIKMGKMECALRTLPSGNCTKWWSNGHSHKLYTNTKSLKVISCWRIYLLSFCRFYHDDLLLRHATHFEWHLCVIIIVIRQRNRIAKINEWKRKQERINTTKRRPLKMLCVYFIFLLLLSFCFATPLWYT